VGYGSYFLAGLLGRGAKTPPEQAEAGSQARPPETAGLTTPPGDAAPYPASAAAPLLDAAQARNAGPDASTGPNGPDTHSGRTGPAKAAP
jgi:hypothetical protein